MQPTEAAGGAADAARALEVERIARRLAARHPDPEARRVYAWIAGRAAAKREAFEGGVS